MLYARSRVIISGLVQGVFFRREISYLARQLSVTGWTRNLSDGSVEVVAEGEKEAIDKLIQFCRVGPSGARVRSVSVKWEAFKGEFRGFTIKR
jgi:acylphosphatase